MAYNPAMYNAYGGPYAGNYGAGLPAPMQMQPGQAVAPQQSYGGMPVKGEIEWVDGEASAKSYQIPQGMTKPVALWDTNDTVIYLKSMNPMGMPNPLQKIHYKMEEQVPKYMGQSGMAMLGAGADSPDAQREIPDMREYVRKDELQQMKDELMQSIRELGNNGGGSAGTAGGRRNTRGEQE